MSFLPADKGFLVSFQRLEAGQVLRIENLKRSLHSLSNSVFLMKAIWLPCVDSQSNGDQPLGKPGLSPAPGQW